MEEFKVLKWYSNKYAMQRPLKEPQSNSKKKCINSIKFDEKMQEVNSMAYQAKPAPNKNRVKNQNKKRNSGPESADPSDDGRTYVIYHLNLGEPKNDWGSDTKWIFVQFREGQTENKKYINNITKHECNVLSIFLNPIKRAK